jgi:hypothetical protein
LRSLRAKFSSLAIFSIFFRQSSLSHQFRSVSIPDSSWPVPLRLLSALHSSAWSFRQLGEHVRNRNGYSTTGPEFLLFFLLEPLLQLPCCGIHPEVLSPPHLPEKPLSVTND